MPDSAHYKSLELAKRRGGVPFPNSAEDSPHLTIQGTYWTIPERGLSVRPKFVGDKVEVDFDAEDWPEAETLIRSVKTRDIATCPQCGQATQTVVDLDAEHGEFLAALYTLAAKVLRVQYALTNDDLTSLLAFGGERPYWIGQLLRWSHGLSGEPEMASLPDMLPEGIFGEDMGETSSITIPPESRHWWQVWK